MLSEAKHLGFDSSGASAKMIQRFFASLRMILGS